jgi:hypothetical protein
VGRGKSQAAPIVLVLEAVPGPLRRIWFPPGRGAARLEGRRLTGWQLYRFAAGASRERFATGHPKQFSWLPRHSDSRGGSAIAFRLRLGTIRLRSGDAAFVPQPGNNV